MPLWFLPLFAIALSLFLTALLIRYSHLIGMIDRPNARSSHDSPTPRGGGLAIVLATLTTITIHMLLTPATDPLLHQPIEAALLISLPIAIIGLLDDRRGVAARWRFLTQALAASVLLLALNPLPGLLIAPGVALPAPALTLGLWFFGVAWVNAFNFMDGIDGLAGTQSIFMLGAAAALTVTGSPDAVSHPLFALMMTLIFAVLGFLIFNWSPAKIFMGDTGSTWLAFIIFALAILTVRSGWMNFGSWLILGAVFVTDTSLTLMTRIKLGEQWYSAHRSHAYQRHSSNLQVIGFSRIHAHRQVTLRIAAINLIWLMPLAWAAQLWPHYNIFICLIAFLPLVRIVLRLGAGCRDPLA